MSSSAFGGSVPKSAEGAAKYAIFGAVCSALMVYGISLLYGVAGTFDWEKVVLHLAVQGVSSAVDRRAGLPVCRFGLQDLPGPDALLVPGCLRGRRRRHHGLAERRVQVGRLAGSGSLHSSPAAVRGAGPERPGRHGIGPRRDCDDDPGQPVRLLANQRQTAAGLLLHRPRRLYHLRRPGLLRRRWHGGHRRLCPGLSADESRGVHRGGSRRAAKRRRTIWTISPAWGRAIPSWPPR